MNKGKFLIADDVMFARKQLKKILENQGYEVVAEAVDGVDVVEKYSEMVFNVPEHLVTTFDEFANEGLVSWERRDELLISIKPIFKMCNKFDAEAWFNDLLEKANWVSMGISNTSLVKSSYREYHGCLVPIF